MTTKPPLRISVEIPNTTFFSEKDRVIFEETICKILRSSVGPTARNVSENMLFDEFQQKIKFYSKHADSTEEARRMAIEAITLSILLNNLR